MKLVRRMIFFLGSRIGQMKEQVPASQLLSLRGTSLVESIGIELMPAQSIVAHGNAFMQLHDVAALRASQSSAHR